MRTVLLVVSFVVGFSVSAWAASPRGGGGGASSTGRPPLVLARAPARDCAGILAHQAPQTGAMLIPTTWKAVARLIPTRWNVTVLPASR